MTIYIQITKHKLLEGNKIIIFSIYEYVDLYKYYKSLLNNVDYALDNIEGLRLVFETYFASFSQIIYKLTNTKTSNWCTFYFRKVYFECIECISILPNLHKNYSTVTKDQLDIV